MASRRNKLFATGITSLVVSAGLATTISADDLIRTRHGWIRIDSAPVVEQPATRDSRPRTIERTVTFLLGAPIRAPGGEMVGRVEDLVIGDDGRVEYLFASFGGVPGFGFKLVPIPWEVTNIDRQRRSIVLGLTRDQLMQAPSFSPKALPDVTDPHWIDMVDAFWRPPVDSTDRIPASRTEREPGDRRDTERAASRMDRSYDRPQSRGRDVKPAPETLVEPRSSDPRD